MYGTIFEIKVKSGHENDLLESMGERTPDGMLAVFESKEAYITNANSSEQHEAFTKMMEHLVAEPTWTDGEHIAGEMI